MLLGASVLATMCVDRRACVKETKFLAMACSKDVSPSSPLGSWELRNGKENGNYYNGLYEDYYKDPFLHS